MTILDLVKHGKKNRKENKMSNNKPLSTHPAHIYRPYNDYLKSDNDRNGSQKIIKIIKSF